ncbi:DMT family transporter [Jannaschia sp. KMU-145]|uniref:DMT family transporter n=1 Tax=Jannaschia halovivens TaxID=3388667 RepID=UPI00396B2F11
MSTTNTAPVTRPTLDNWISIVSLGVIWGGTFMIVAIALRGYGPVTVAAARVALGGLALVGLALASGRPFPRLDGLLVAFLLGLGLLNAALPFLLLAWGQQHVPSAFAGLSMAVLPLFLLPLAHVFVPGDQLTPRRSAGFGMGLIGAIVLLGPGVLAAGEGDLAALGRLACIAATLCYAVSSIMTRRCPPMDAIWLSAAILVVAALGLVPAMLWFEGVPGPATPGQMGAIVALGLVPTALAGLLRVRIIRTAGPGFMTLVNYQVPVWSIVFGVTLLGEDLPGRFYVALALIAGGLFVSQSGRKA